MTTKVPASLLDVTIPVPALDLIQVHTFSGALTYNVENFSSTYDDYLLIYKFTPPTSGAPTVKFKVGGSYLGTSTYRSHASKLSSGSGLYASWNTSTLPYITLSANTTCSNAATANHVLMINVLNANSAAKYPQINWRGSVDDGTNLVMVNGAADIPTAGALQGLQLMVNDGTVINVAGTVSVYGYKKSL